MEIFMLCVGVLLLCSEYCQGKKKHLFAVTWRRKHTPAKYFTLDVISLTHYRPPMPFGNRKFFLEDLFSSSLSQFKKYHPSGNPKFINSHVF